MPLNEQATSVAAMCDRAQAALLEATTSSTPVEDAAFTAFVTAAFGPERAGKAKKDHLPELREADPVVRQLLQDRTRCYLFSLIEEAFKARQSVLTYVMDGGSFPSILRFLEILLWICNQRLLEPGLIFTLLEDLAESSTVVEAEGVFSFIHDKVAVLRQAHIFSRGKLQLLRLCNNLLRRLNKSVFSRVCGKIMLTLADLWHLCERSGVNSSGLANTSHPIAMDEVAPDDKDSEGEPVDQEFYKLFWGLQRKLQDPLVTAKQYASLAADIRAVLDRFGTVPIKSSWKDGVHKDSLEWGVFYQPRPHLLRIQLQDAAFRVPCLVQCLTTLHRLKHSPPSPDLRTEDKQDLDTLFGKIMGALEQTGGDGHLVCKIISDVLEHEVSWIAWKGDGCKDFVKAFEDSTKGTSNAMDIDVASTADVSTLGRTSGLPKYKEGMTSKPVITKMQKLRPRQQRTKWERAWMNVPPRLRRDKANGSGLRKGEGRDVPGLKELFMPAIEEMDPESTVEEELKKKNSHVYQWQVLRLASESHHQHYELFAVNNVEKFAEVMFPEEVAKYAPDRKPKGDNSGSEPATKKAKASRESSPAAKSSQPVKTPAASKSAPAAKAGSTPKPSPGSKPASATKVASTPKASPTAKVSPATKASPASKAAPTGRGASAAKSASARTQAATKTVSTRKDSRKDDHEERVVRVGSKRNRD